MRDETQHGVGRRAAISCGCGRVHRLVGPRHKAAGERETGEARAHLRGKGGETKARWNYELAERRRDGRDVNGQYRT